MVPLCVIVPPPALKEPLEKAVFPAKVIEAPLRLTELPTFLLTVKVPAGMVPAVRVELGAPSIVMFTVPLAPSLTVLTLPVTLRVPELIRQLAPHPVKAAKVKLPAIFHVPVTVFVPARLEPEPFSNLKMT